MKLNVKFNYSEGYLPTKRHRKLRYRDAEDITTVDINEATIEEAPIAFLVHEAHENEPTEYRVWNDKLWRKVMWSERLSRAEGLYPITEFFRSIEYHSYFKHNKTREEAEKEKHDYVKNYLIIDNTVYLETSEPRYVLMTFGLGGNHGGTSLMTSNYYNPNISHTCYFNALEREQAITEAIRVAKGRGDTNYIDGIGQFYNIEVLIPETVKCNPSKEHGDGDPFLNQLKKVTETTDDVTTKAFLATTVLMKELEEQK